GDRAGARRARRAAGRDRRRRVVRSPGAAHRAAAHLGRRRDRSPLRLWARFLGLEHVQTTYFGPEIAPTTVRAGQAADQPPSDATTWPLMLVESAESRNVIEAASCSGIAMSAMIPIADCTRPMPNSST